MLTGSVLLSKLMRVSFLSCYVKKVTFRESLFIQTDEFSVDGQNRQCWKIFPKHEVTGINRVSLYYTCHRWHFQAYERRLLQFFLIMQEF